MQQSDGGNATLKLQSVTALAASYFQNNHVTIADVPHILSMFGTEVDKLLNPTVTAPVADEPKTPAVSIKKSVTPDYLIDLFTGRKFKSLKRYLRTSHNLSPEEYRAYWGLPKDYPMVAPNYAAARSNLAKQMGLGRMGGPGRTRATAETPADGAPVAKRTRGPNKAKADTTAKTRAPRKAKTEAAPAAAAPAPEVAAS